MRDEGSPLLDPWSLTNLAIMIAANVTVYTSSGPKALAYLAMSLFFSIGLHPLGARWIQRHYLTGEGEQETFSYYGLLNALRSTSATTTSTTTSRRCPGTGCPDRAIAPECTTPQVHTSWTKLLFPISLRQQDLALVAHAYGRTAMAYR